MTHSGVETRPHAQSNPILVLVSRLLLGNELGEGGSMTPEIISFPGGAMLRDELERGRSAEGMRKSVSKTPRKNAKMKRVCQSAGLKPQITLFWSPVRTIPEQPSFKSGRSPDPLEASVVALSCVSQNCRARADFAELHRNVNRVRVVPRGKRTRRILRAPTSSNSLAPSCLFALANR